MQELFDRKITLMMIYFAMALGLSVSQMMIQPVGASSLGEEIGETIGDVLSELGNTASNVDPIEDQMKSIETEELKRIDTFVQPQINSTGQSTSYEVITVPEMNNTLWKNLTLPSIGINIQIPDNWNASIKDRDFFTYSGKLYDMSIDPKLTSNNFAWLGPQPGETTLTVSNKGAPFINNTGVLANIILKDCITNAFSESDCELIEPVSSSKYLIDKQPATSFKYKSYDEEFEYIEIIHNGVNYEIQFNFKEAGLDYLSLDYNSQNTEGSEKANQIKDYIINSIRWISKR